MNEVRIFQDECDAQKFGEEFIRKYIHLGTNIHYTENEGPQIPKIKWCGLFDDNDKLVCCYLMNRDMKNFTQVSCFVC